MTTKGPYMDSYSPIPENETRELGVNSDIYLLAVTALQKCLLSPNIQISDLEYLSKISGELSRSRPLNNGMRIPLEDIGGEKEIVNTLQGLKAQHTLGMDGDVKVLILSHELISKLRVRVIQLTKVKVSSIVSDKTYNPIVRVQVDKMKAQLSLLGVTKKELESLEE